MSQLLILGAGGHGRVVAEAAEATGRWRQTALLDDRYAALNGSLRWPVLSGIEEADRFLPEYADAIVAVGDSALRLKWIERLKNQGFCLPSLVHPAAWVSPSAMLGDGSVVMANATLQADSALGRGCIVNTGANIDHDCRLDDGVHVCPGANLGGDVQVGAESWLGIGCSVIQGIRIGRQVTVGAGAAVVRDIADGLTVVGVPAREIASQRIET